MGCEMDGDARTRGLSCGPGGSNEETTATRKKATTGMQTSPQGEVRDMRQRGGSGNLRMLLQPPRNDESDGLTPLGLLYEAQDDGMRELLLAEEDSRHLLREAPSQVQTTRQTDLSKLRSQREPVAPTGILVLLTQTPRTTATETCS